MLKIFNRDKHIWFQSILSLPFINDVNFFAQIYGAAMLVYLHGAPTWRPENSVNIWNLLWLSTQLIIWTDQATT